MSVTIRLRISATATRTVDSAAACYALAVRQSTRDRGEALRGGQRIRVQRDVARLCPPSSHRSAASICCVANRRTTVAASYDDLAVLEQEGRRRGVSLTQVLREAVEREAQRLRAKAPPRFGIVLGDGTATRVIADEEHAPARRSGRSP